MSRLPPDCRLGFSRVLSLDDFPIGHRPLACRQAEDRLEGDMAIKAAVVTEDEFVQVGIDVLAAEAMVGAETPPLQKGEDPMDPFQRYVSRHVADHAGIVAIVGEARIGRVAVRHQRRAWRDVRLDECVDVLRFVARDRRETATAGHRIQILRAESLGFLRLFGRMIDDLDGADDQHFAGLGDLEEAVVGAERHFRLVDFDDSVQLFTLRVDHRAAQLLGKKPGGLVGAETELSVVSQFEIRSPSEVA